MPSRTRFRRITERILRLLSGPRVFCFATIALQAACITPMSPRAKLDDAVQEMNMAARFGRTDVAMERVSAGTRDDFIKRHKLWGSELRVVDVEFGGLEKMAESEASVMVNFSWFRPRDGVLRMTTVRQTWVNDHGTGPWHLSAEERASGDVGLLGEPPVVVVKPEKKDARFDVTVIKGN